MPNFKTAPSRLSESAFSSKVGGGSYGYPHLCCGMLGVQHQKQISRRGRGSIS